jgi:transcriptional regulator GlxA family with amidase domain
MQYRPRVIAFIVAPPVDLLNLAGLASVFSYPRLDGKPAYSIRILTTGPEKEVAGMAGIAVSNGIPYSEYTGPIDTLVAISGEGALGELSPDVFQWLRKRAARVRRIASVCTGTFMLAATGLLDGKRVTTHWHHVDKLAKKFPLLLIEKDPIFIQDGNIYTTAGVTAGIDMALTFVEDDLGHETAMAIARELVLYIRRPGSEAQFSTLLAQQIDVSGTPMRDLPAWARAHLTQRLDVNTLAKAVIMTPRTFARQFDMHFGTTPARWVQSLRVEAACGHLETQELPIKAIARLTGFRDEQAMRRAFMQQISMTPKDYRERFGAFMASDLHDTISGLGQTTGHR